MPPTVDALELKYRRRTVEEFIRAKSMSIQLKRRPKEAAGNGGWKYGAEVTLPAQTFRIMQFKRRLTKERVPNEVLGKVINADDILVGAWNVDIQERDYFEYDGVEYEVDFVDQENVDHTLAAIVNRSEN